jgi:hypothetical protein
MSVLDKVVAAVTPEPSEDERREARTQARSASASSPWIGMILDHHEGIERAFDAVRSATTAANQRSAQKELALLLTGHSMAEEATLYPAMALSDQKGHSTAAYTEQSAAKVQLAALEQLEALSQDYHDKLEHLRAAVAHHIYEEESKWFPELCNVGGPTMQAHLTQRYTEEFSRYMGMAGQAPTITGTSALKQEVAY